MPADASHEPRYCRAPGLVWRVVDHEVLTQRIGGTAGEAADGHRLAGWAAVVWAALDEPADRTELARRIGHDGFDADALGGGALDAAALDDALAQLCASAHVVIDADAEGGR